MLRVALLPKDPNDEKHVMIEIRAGAGGVEAGLFAADLFRMYSRYAQREGWRTEVMNSTEGEQGEQNLECLPQGLPAAASYTDRGQAKERAAR